MSLDSTHTEKPKSCVSHTALSLGLWMWGKFHQTSHIHVRLEFSCELNERSHRREVSIQKVFVDVSAYFLWRGVCTLLCPCHPAFAIRSISISTVLCYLSKEFPCHNSRPGGESCWSFHSEMCIWLAWTCWGAWRVGPSASRLGRWLPDACTRSVCLGGPFLQPSFRSCSRRCSLESVSSAFQIFLQAI